MKNANVTQGSLFPELEVNAPQPRFKTDKEPVRDAVKELKDRIKELETENETLRQKAEAFDELISSNSLFTTTVVAKSFGKSAIWLNQYLHKKGVQYLQGDVWVLYARYQSSGYTRICWYEYGQNSKGKSLERAHTYWTAKGVVFIRKLLKADGFIE